MNWLQSLVMGLFSGLTDILPVSSQAHQTLLMKFFGITELSPVMRLAIRGAVLVTLLVVCWSRIRHIRRQIKLVSSPRRRRHRSADLAALMDVKILQTSLLAIIPCLLLGGLTAGLRQNLLWLVAASLVNAVILYLPRLFPTADKDSRLVTPYESLLMGLGSGASVLPGISSVGVCHSIGVLHGIDRGYMIHLTVMMHMIVIAGLSVGDVMELIRLGGAALDGAAVLSCALAAAGAASGTALGCRILHAVVTRDSISGFSLYSFGVALFTFILYLIV